MTIRCKFVGGPMQGMDGHVRDLPQCQIFFDERQRLVYCYNRVDETVYMMEEDVSKALTAQYDVAFEKFGKTGQSVDAWSGSKTRT